jgi:hypothetical protein
MLLLNIPNAVECSISIPVQCPILMHALSVLPEEVPQPL